MRIKRALLLSLCIVMLLSLCFTYTPAITASAERTIYEVENEIKKYEKMLSDARSRLSSVSAGLAEVQGKANHTEEEIALYIEEIDLLQAQVSIYEGIRDSYYDKRSEVSLEKAVAEGEYEHYLNMYATVMRFVYENGDTNSFEMLFSSDGLGDYLTKAEDFNSIMECASELVKNIDSTVKDLEILDAELAETQSKYDEYLEKITAEKVAYQEKITQLETIASDLGTSYDGLKSTYSSTSSEVAQLKAKIAELEDERKELYKSTGVFAWPLTSDVRYTVTSQYGTRVDPLTGKGTEFHKGIDIACAKNSRIVAVDGGTVTKAAWYGGYGNCVIVYHGNGLSTLYGHCTTLLVKQGDVVNQGDVIALVGTTGRSTGYHLHLSVLKDGAYVNPNDYLPNGFYTKR